MAHPHYFEAIGIMYRADKIHSFADILLYVKRTPIATAIGLGGSRFKVKADDPSKFTDHEIGKMAELFGIPPEDMKRVCQSGKGR